MLQASEEGPSLLYPSIRAWSDWRKARAGWRILYKGGKVVDRQLVHYVLPTQALP